MVIYEGRNGYMKLIDFAYAPDADYLWLEQQIDALPEKRAFRFEHCELPPECVPRHMAVGMYKQHSCYVLYLEGPARYSGHNNSTKSLCEKRHLNFQSFNELKQFLQTLDAEPVATPEHPQTLPTSGTFTSSPNSSTGINGITPPAAATGSTPDFQVIQEEMGKHIIGQDIAVTTIAHQVSLHLKKASPKKPLSIVTYGPPGTGKSEAAKVLANALSGLGTHKYATVWTELNTFSEAHSVYRLIGSPPGYVGYDDAPVFEAVTQNPYTVFIFDELDKAHPAVLKTFMSILDEGRCASRKELADHSREFDFRHCIFIFTSNFCLGASPKKRIGFSLAEDVTAICHKDDTVEVRYKEKNGEKHREDERAAVTKRIYRETESARKAFVKAGVLREIASRFNCFVEFQELSMEAKVRILAKQVVETGFEYNIRLTYIASSVLQGLIDNATAEDALTVRSFKSVIEGYLAAAFADAGAGYPGQTLRLEGSIEEPLLLPG
jgi:hypothetical protein